jgi:CPA2 family monovalent cation:H+ antiporter-2
MAATPILAEAGFMFVLLAIGGAVAWRARQSVIPAYLLVGMLAAVAPPVGGFDPSTLADRPFVTLLAEFGIVLLLFFIGLEFNVERLLASRDRITRAGVLDLAINGGIGLVLGVAFGLSLLGAVLLAGVVYISSSAVITKSLIDLGWIADPESETVLGVLVFEDVVIAVYLAVVGAIVLGGGDPRSIALSLGLSLTFLLALGALGRYGAPVLERVFAVRSDELFLVAVFGSAVAVGGIALLSGVSEAVAAFFLGSAFGATSHVERIERIITSERDLYAAVFFFWIGLQTDPRLLTAVAVPVAVLVVVTTASKLASGYLGGRAYGLSTRRSSRVALALVARGEFSLVIAALAATTTAPGISETIPALAVGYVLVMSILGTVLMREASRIERWLGLDAHTGSAGP